MAGDRTSIFPHHENEIAQSEAFTHAAPMANFWVHNGLLQLGGEKMSKSVGNLVSIRELLERGDGQVFRFLVLNSHYRNPLVFNDETLESARRGLARMSSALRDSTLTGSRVAPGPSPQSKRRRARGNTIS